MLKTVGRYLDPWEAHILRARLEADGIPASITGDQHAIVNWPLSFALGGTLLQVPAGFVDQASEIIAAYHAGTLEQDLITEHPDSIEFCPTCGGTDLACSIPFKQKALAVVTFLWASAPFPTRASRIQCKTCGDQWGYGA